MGKLIDLDKVEFLKVDGNIEFNHGVDYCINTLLKQPLVEAIPKDEYKARLKADMMAMLKDLRIQMEEYEPKWVENDEQSVASCRTWEDLDGIIQEKISTLEVENGNDNITSPTKAT